jgi:hypothetical protein
MKSGRIIRQDYLVTVSIILKQQTDVTIVGRRATIVATPTALISNMIPKPFCWPTYMFTSSTVALVNIGIVMKFGITLPQSGSQATKENVIHLAMMAEKEHLDSLWVGEI